MKTLKLVGLASIAIIAISCEDDDPIRVLDIDLQATAINFSIEKDPDSDFTGTATITGIITNIGTENFVSSSNQQRILLYERELGVSAPEILIGEINFTTLNAGEELSVSYTRNWDASSPGEGEFPPNYILQINYDPDITIDSNQYNDDKNSANNSLVESGSVINDLF